MGRPRVELPEDDEPLDTPNGPVAPLAPAGRKMIEIPSNRQAVSIIEGTRRKLGDLPVTPKHLNPIACVCLYTMYGLDLQEISVATGLAYEQINNIRMSNEYAIMQRAIVDTVLETDTEQVKDYVKKAATKAAQRVESLVDSPNSDVALRASKDILDRAGLRPADVVEVRGRMDLGLVIEVVDRKNDDNRPVIDME